MPQSLSLTLAPEQGLDEAAFRAVVLQKLSLPNVPDVVVRKRRQSIDARGRQVRVHVEADVYAGETPPPQIQHGLSYPDVSRARAVMIVGAGPAGLFAALRLIELGLKPIVLERGSDVRARRRDLAAINKDHVVNPESNYCFGEGGAGTYSDGKLYTRSGKRGDIRRILEILVAHGATDQILVDAHPHIGTNKLPQVVTALRETILNAGGEVHFDTKVVDLLLTNGELNGVVTADSQEHTGIGVILATGHSARDIFHLLHQRDVLIEAKPFAMGVRIEHQQSLIDTLQYHLNPRAAGVGRSGIVRGPYLPAASYSLVTQTRFGGVERGVFSFCMCPGGFIVPSATAPGELVVNGMSPSRRDSPYANSGLVVAITEADLKPYAAHGPLAGLMLQQAVEQRACAVGSSADALAQTAPAQRVADFVQGRVSGTLLPTSYQPGLLSADMRDVLPDHIAQPLREGLRDFGQKMRGYVSNDGQLIGVESRTSSPVRIPRHRDTCEHVQVRRLFPCGEGAGYAGGIVSAAMDGERCANELAALYR
jgi:uncharacterized protein